MIEMEEVFLFMLNHVDNFGWSFICPYLFWYSYLVLSVGLTSSTCFPIYSLAFIGF